MPSARSHDGKTCVERYEIECNQAFKDMAASRPRGRRGRTKCLERFPLIRGQIAVEFSVHLASNESRAVACPGLLPGLHEDRATEARREFGSNSTYGNAPSTHFDGGICLVAKQMIGTIKKFFLTNGVLAKIAEVIEASGLQIDRFRFDFRQCGFGKNVVGDILDRRAGYFMNEADVSVFTRHHAGDDFAPRDFGIDDSLAAPTSIVDHDNKILHRAPAVTLVSPLLLKIGRKSSEEF